MHHLIQIFETGGIPKIGLCKLRRTKFPVGIEQRQGRTSKALHVIMVFYELLL